MSNWTSGYVADIDYTYGYYFELNPLRTQFALLNAGLVVPQFDNACELGFGQGLSTNIHAAGSSTNWYGTDFNPSQAGFAQELASVSRSDARLYDEAFADFCNRSDLPDFDFICMHGIWSWISDENRTVIVDFIRRKLKVGGVLYVSYNTLPGWAAFAPMRHLMTQHAEVVGSTASGILSRVDGALDFAERLLATKPQYATANPQVSDRIKALKGQNRHYLAHEYFNRDWTPMHFSTMVNWLETTKLDFACSAHYLDQLEAVNLTAEQIKFLQEIPNDMLRQSVRDFMVNNQFRKDYWVKGARKLSAFDHFRLLREHRVVLCSNRADIQLNVKGALGDAKVNLGFYDPVLDALADNTAKSLGQIHDEIASKSGLDYTQLVEVMLVLLNGGYVATVQPENIIAAAKKKSDALNANLIERARGGNEINYLASPVIGGGIPVNHIQQHFLLAINQGLRNPEEWAQSTWTHLSSLGQKLAIHGKQIETPEDNITELNSQARKFASAELPVLKALKVV